VSYYQKYRPQKIAELNLLSVRGALEAALKSGKISHAYLFVGPRGSGKTSTARILSQVVNCDLNKDLVIELHEPCGVCEPCKTLINGGGVDVIEIDAASNGLVEDIRDLRDKVRLSPLQLRKKIYIIDEVHMVSTAGFNALLKTLEEPPKHAMFILCTTEAHKVPETIVSRCSKINFTKATMSEMVESLSRVVAGEKLKADMEALEAITEVADGSFREAHKVLEQLASFGVDIDRGLVNKTLGSISSILVKKVIEAALSGRSAEVVESFMIMESNGVKAQVVLVAMLAYLKSQIEISVKSGANVRSLIALVDALVGSAEKIKFSPDPLLPLEMAILASSINNSNNGGPSKEVEQTKIQTVDKPTENVARVMPVEEVVVEVEMKKDVDKVITLENVAELKASIDKIKEEWGGFLDNFATSNGSLAGMLRNSAPMELQGKSLTLSVRSRFQQDMIERDTKKKIIEQEMERIWGPVTLKTVLIDIPARTEPNSEDANVNTVAVDVEKIFS
jgi:DNA polymerase-3 subunit gamma/tau